MGSEFVNQSDFKQDTAEAKTKEAPAVKAKRSGDAMGSVGTNRASGGQRGAPPVLMDSFADTWSETAGGNTTQYQRRNLRLDDTERVNVGAGKIEGMPAVPVAGVGIIGDNHDPMSNKYQRGRYVTKAAIEKPEGETPEFSEIAELNDAGAEVDGVVGTLNEPEVSQELVPDSLFIDNQTYQEDVRQGNLGDCYFLAAILQVIHYDPSKIVKMMKQSGDTMTTTLYHREGHGILATWKPTEITTKLGLIERNGGGPIGARVRLAYEPKLARWSSSIDGTTLKINKTQLFEAALWVNCLEQAFSVFSQKYGQYGRGVNGEQNMERFSSIEDGVAGPCLHMLFGNDASNSKSLRTQDPKDDQDTDDTQALIKANKKIIKELIKLAKAQDGNAGRDMHMSCMISEETSVERLKTYTNVVLSDLNKVLAEQRVPDQALLEAWDKLEMITRENNRRFRSGRFNANVSDATMISIKRNLDDISKSLEHNSRFQDLNLSSYKTLREAIGSVVQYAYNTNAHSDADKKKGNIFIFSAHIYNVDHVDLKDAEGRELKNERERAIFRSLDVRQTMVTVQNPHAQTKPNYHQEDTSPDSGTFEITLESFLRSTEYITSCSVKNRRI